MKQLFTITVSIWFILLSGCSTDPGAGIEWDILNQEVRELYQAGEYDRAVPMAHKALEVAEQNVGPDHPDVATSLN
ncbi:MAG: tetratricopeptide repeat protein, partial [Chloroflexi bacterium]|nr:tetratricopeptide repeat protein [Chloroflexota bacterium]